MNVGQFQSQISRAWDLIEAIEFGGTRRLHPIYPKNAAAEFRQLSYTETWLKCYEERYFDIELADHSLVQFRAESFAPLKVSYAYYECPYHSVDSFEDYLAEWGVDVDSEDAEYLRDEYDNYKNQQVKEMCTPIRYDYDPICYVEGRHPASHVHFGHQSNIRVGTKKIIRPLSFVFFILRQVYPEKWDRLKDHPDAAMLTREVSENLDAVDRAFWRLKDGWEMHLH